MDGIFDRLGNLIKSFIQTESDGTESLHSGDPDLDSAWDELDEYLQTGKQSERQDFGQSNSQSSARTNHARGRASSGPPEELRQDYGNLEVPFGAPFETVRKAYKNLLIEYHPDKHGGSSQKQRIANEITKKINFSFQRIKRYHESGSV